MKQEIYQNGPIACGIAVNNHFENYKGGVFSDDSKVAINHIISIVGFDVDDTNKEYWIGRNSWGSHWGENGFFRIEMHKNTLSIEEDCYWAIPSLTKVDELDGKEMV